MAANVRGAMDPDEAELQERRVWLARGESPAAIAAYFKRSPGTIYNQASRERELIASIREGLLGVVDAQAAVTDALNWANNVVRSTQVAEANADRLLELSYDPDLPARDVAKYQQTARHWARDAWDLNGIRERGVHLGGHQISGCSSSARAGRQALPCRWSTALVDWCRCCPSPRLDRAGGPAMPSS